MLLSFDILERNVSKVDSINVFPVADKDTGRNVFNAVRPLIDTEFEFSEEFFDEYSRRIMLTAGGSSGNILALYAIDLSKNFNNNYTKMCKGAVDFVYKMMYEPQEGTILTAMRSVPNTYTDAEDFIYKFIENTYNVLLNGPDLLPILKENNTIDSGTLGFLYILCDIYRCITGKDISPEIDVNEPLFIVNEDIENKYCVEITLLSTDDELKQLLSKRGSELVFLTAGDKTKIHIHTDDYLSVIDLCRKFGTIEKYKIEDMTNNNEYIILWKYYTWYCRSLV